MARVTASKTNGTMTWLEILIVSECQTELRSIKILHALVLITCYLFIHLFHAPRYRAVCVII